MKTVWLKVMNFYPNCEELPYGCGTSSWTKLELLRAIRDEYCEKVLPEEHNISKVLCMMYLPVATFGSILWWGLRYLTRGL